MAPPYDVVSPEQRAGSAPWIRTTSCGSILPEGEGDSKYANAAAALESWTASGVLVRDAEPAFYRYDQSFLPPGGVGKLIMRRGFLALVRLAPLSAGVIQPHERTLAGPVDDRLRLFRATRTNLSPGFMLYRDPNGVIDPPLHNAERLAEFSTQDGIHHAFAKVTAPDAVAAITEGVARSTLLIADGQHRYEAALRYSEEVSRARPDAGERAEHRYFMTFLANGDDPSLVIFPTHRLVHSLPTFSYDDLLARAAAWFSITALPHGVDAIAALAALRGAGKTAPSVVAVAAHGPAAVLSLRSDVDVARHPTLGERPSVLQKTDVAVLHSANPRARPRHHEGGPGHEDQPPLRARRSRRLRDVRSGKGQVALPHERDARQGRPPGRGGRRGHAARATFFHPKVLSGLAIHTLDPVAHRPAG